MAGTGPCALSLLLTSACGTAYVSTRPHTATLADTKVDVDRVIAVDGPRRRPEAPKIPVEMVYVHGTYEAERRAVLGLPTLAAPASSPCSTGASATFVVMDRFPSARGGSQSGDALWGFARASTEERSLLRGPTVLDVPIAHFDGRPSECLRVPVVDDRGGVEWERKPALALGYGFEMLALFDRVYGANAAPMFAVRVGPWLGPVRLRAEVDLGGALAKAKNPNLVGYAYGGGVRADTLVFSAGRFGLGAALGYDVLGISFAPEVSWYSQRGRGFQGWIHGPRAGLAFELLAQPAIGPAFRRTRNSESASFEVYAASEWSHDRASPTPALWFMLNLDASL
jgi:hypothetical protein